VCCKLIYYGLNSYFLVGSFLAFERAAVSIFLPPALGFVLTLPSPIHQKSCKAPPMDSPAITLCVSVFCVVYILTSVIVKPPPMPPHGGVTFSVVRPFVCSNLRRRYFENEWTDLDANWKKWLTARGHEAIDQFWGWRGHTTPKVDL